MVVSTTELNGQTVGTTASTTPKALEGDYGRLSESYCEDPPFSEIADSTAGGGTGTFSIGPFALGSKKETVCFAGFPPASGGGAGGAMN